MASQTSLTELDAVNMMLSVIGEAPINVLSDTPQTVDVSLAQKQLGNTLNEVQAKGYNFNREYNITLLPDGNGYINVPTNYTRVQIDEGYGDTSMDIVHRGTRLYDRKNRTYVFSKNVVVRCIVLLPFDQIPECARRYISIKAARALADRIMGDQATHAFTAMEEAQAKVLLDNEEGENTGHTIFDNWSVGQTMQRNSHNLAVGFIR